MKSISLVFLALILLYPLTLMAFGLGFNKDCYDSNSDHDPSNLYTWIATDGNNDLGDGSYENPYATFSKVNSLPTLIGTKKTIYVKSGVYTQTYFSFAKDYTWIAWGDVTLKATSSSYVVYLSTSAASIIDGFIIDREGINSYTVFAFNSTTTNKTFRNCTFINPNPTKQHVYIPSTCDNISFVGCTFNGNCQNAIYWHNNTNSNAFSIIGCTFNGMQSRTLCWYATGAAMTTVNITDNVFNFSGGYGVFIEKRVSLLFQNNTVNYVNDITSNGFMTQQSLGSYATGSVTIDSNFINLGNHNWGTNEIYGVFQFAGANNNIDVQFTNNYITGYSTVSKNGIFYYSDQKSMKFNNNIIDLQLCSSLRDIINIAQPTKDNSGVMECKYNVVKARCIYHCLSFGTEQTGSGDNRIKNLLIEGNLIYANKFYNPLYISISHTIFVGFNIDYTIRFNTVYGGGYAIVSKHGNLASMNSGGVFCNVLIDSVCGIYDKGMSSLKIYNNTIINTIAQEDRAINISRNEDIGGTEDIFGVVIRNNVLYSNIAVNKALIKFNKQTDGNSDYNMMYTPSSVICYIGPVAMSFAQWQAAGNDIHGFNIVPGLMSLGDINTVDPRPAYNSNVVGIGIDLGSSYDMIMNYNSVPPDINTTIHQTGFNWVIGAYLPNQSLETPSIPQNVSISKLVDQSVLIQWSQSDNATEYLIYRSNDPNPSSWGFPIASTTQLSYTDSSLTDQKHFYKISALISP